MTFYEKKIDESRKLGIRASLEWENVFEAMKQLDVEKYNQAIARCEELAEKANKAVNVACEMLTDERGQ